MSAVTVLILIVMVIVYLTLRSILRFVSHHGAELLIIRFLAGHLLHGEARTDAGWFSHGTRVIHPSGNASKWEHRPHAHRAAVRWGVLLVISGLVYGLITARLDTVIALLAAGVLVLAYVSYVSKRRIEYGRLERTVIHPLASALAPMLDLSVRKTADSITINPGYASADPLSRIGLIVLPDDYAASPAQRSQVEHLVSSRLSVEADFQWRTSSIPQTLVFSRTAPLPTMVRLDSKLDTIAKLSSDEVLLGVDSRGNNACWNMASDDPHFFAVAPSRRGKTKLLLSIICQVLSKDGSALVIDPKRVGVHQVLSGHPNAVVFRDHRDVEGMWDAIHAMRLELDTRIDAYDANPDVDFSRHVIAIDEISMFSSISSQYWQTIRSSRDSKIPPVWDDIRAIAYAGAQFKMNLVVFGQAINERILPGMVGQFGTRMLAGYSKRDFDRLVGTTPVIQSPRTRGSFLLHNGQPQLIQSLLGSDPELRELAMTVEKVSLCHPWCVILPCPAG